MAHGADLANMGEAWWVPIVQIPGDTIDGHQRSRSVRLERTRPAQHHRQPGRQPLRQRGLRLQLDGRRVPLPRPPRRLRQRSGVDRVRRPAPQAVRLPGRRAGRRSAGLVLQVARIWPSWPPRPASTPTAWPARSSPGTTTSPTATPDPDFGRGSSAYDGYWGDPNAVDAGRPDAGPAGHPAVLRGAGGRGRDGHQGRAAHRPRRPRPARHRARRSRACSPRATRWPA